MLLYSIDKARGLLAVTASGVVTTADMQLLRVQLKADPNYESRFAALIDLTGASALEFQAQDLKQLASHAVTQASSKRAIVAPTDLGFGLVRMFQVFSEQSGYHEVRAFRDTALALRWIEED